MRAGWLASVTLAVAIFVTFRPVIDHQFLNWDDPDVVAANPRLAQAPAALVGWAFTTREMGHYQPLSWLALAATAGSPASPARVHGLALVAHAVNTVLLLWLTALLLEGRGLGRDRWWLALVAAAIFALHPLRVEPVAWASALPYLLSYAPLLVAVGWWVLWLRRGTTALLAASVMLFAISQLTRVTAPLLPVVLVALAQLDPLARPRTPRALAVAVLPFLLVAVPLALAEASARDVETLAEVGVAQRLAWALVHPALYVWRTLSPIALTPLDALPRSAQVNWTAVAGAVLASAAVVAASARVWSHRAALAVWASYLALLAPVVGLFPSGLQVTADRYTYGPALVLSVALAAVLGALRPPVRHAGVALAGIAAVVAAVAAHAQTAYWADSLTLWSRAVALDANNDVALYNLALAELDAGRREAGTAHLEALVALVPDHDLGRARLAGLLADREQQAADGAANAGRLAEAVEAYTRLLGHDPTRLRARLNRGMALVRLGDFARGAVDLEASGAASADDPAVAGALAFAWAETGRGIEAVALLRRAATRHPNDLALALNLAQLLTTGQPPQVRDPLAALELAARINDATGGRDPRVLATLAEALAATGQPREAASAWDAAIAVATESGDAAMATDLRRRAAAAR